MFNFYRRRKQTKTQAVSDGGNPISGAKIRHLHRISSAFQVRGSGSCLTFLCGEGVSGGDYYGNSFRKLDE